MPNLKASIKDVRQVKKRRAHNKTKKDTMKKLMKQFVETVKSDKKAALELVPSLYKAIDKTAKTNVIHRNTAARRKSQVAKLVK